MAKNKKTRRSKFKLYRPLKFKSKLLIALAVVVAGFGAYWLYQTFAATANSFDSASEKVDVDHINGARAQSGLKSLFWDQCLTDVARGWSKSMAASGSISHNPNLASQVSAKCGNNWSGLGENVGVGPSEADIFNAYMNSSAHRANILDSTYDFVGVGEWYDGTDYWSTQVFADCNGCSSNWTKGVSTTSTTSSTTIYNYATNGQLVTSKSGGTVYYIYNGKKNGIPSTKVFDSWGFKWDHVHHVSDAVLSNLPSGQTMGYREGTLVRNSNGTVYVVDQIGDLPSASWKKRGITSSSAFSQCGYNWDYVINDDSINNYAGESNISGCPAGQRPDGQLLRASTGSVYYIGTDANGNRYRQGIGSQAVLASYAFRNPIIDASDISSYPGIPNMGFRIGSLVQVSGSASVYVIDQSDYKTFISKGIPSACTFDAYGFVWGEINAVTSLSGYQTGTGLARVC